MGRDLELTGAGRCPSCRARVPAGAAWCGQCWLDLRAAAEPGPVPAAPVRAAAARPAPRNDTAGWPCAACGQRSDLAQPTCSGCGAGFLAGLGGDAPSLVLPLVGDLAALSPRSRYVLAAALAGVVALLGMLLLAAGGLLLRP